MITRLHRLLLRFYPRDFRERFGDEMLATAHALEGEPAARRLRGLKDAVVSAFAVRTDLRREHRHRVGRGHWLADLQFSIRTLRKAPGFTAAAVLTLGLGIGAYTVVYAVVDAMLLRPLPFGDRSDRLVTLHSTHPTQAQDWDNSEISYADLADVRDRTSALEAVEGVLSRNFSVATPDDSARVLGASVTPGLFAMLGVAPVEGRLFRTEDAALPGFEPVVILSHPLWQRLFGGDRAIIGQPVLLNARQVTVIGVMPEGFLFPEQHQLWLPYAADRTTGRANRAFIGVGLLRADVSLARAAADLTGVAASLASVYPDTNRDWGIHVMPLRQFYIGDSGGLTAMLAAVSLLLLVACANVAGLLIARGASRDRELVTRAALGASRMRLGRLLLTEAAVVAGLGGLLGVALSMWGLKALLATVAEMPAYWAYPAINARVLSSAIAVTALVALAAGLVPAWRLSRVDVSAAGTATRAVGGTRGHRRFQRALVVAQVAVSFALVLGATLLAASAVALQRADAGFDPSPILSGRFYIAGDAYDDPGARAGAVARLTQTIAAVPGITAAAITQSIPADDGGSTVLVRYPSGAADAVGVTSIATTQGLWDTLGLRLVDGRTFTATEIASPETASVIVNQRLAERFWPGQSALDRPVQLVNARGDVTATARVIGIAPNLVYEEFGETTPQSELNLYLPSGRSGGRTLAFLARSSGNPAAHAQQIRQAIRSVDPSFATFDIVTMTERRRLTTWGERFLATTFSTFAVIAVCLACLGTWAIVAYAVTQRRREVGVRLAIGATRADIVSLFLKGGAALAAGGLLIGTPLAIVTARVLGSGDLLFGVSPWDPRVWIGLSLAMAAAVLVATLQPAVRAGRVDPSEALRQ